MSFDRKKQKEPMSFNNRTPLIILMLSFAPLVPALGQSPENEKSAENQPVADTPAEKGAQDEETQVLEPIVVSAKISRLPAALDTFPGTVTRIDLQQIEAMADFADDPAQLLSFQVPGFGTAAPASASNFEQTLRGRKATILIDGVPISTPLRDGRHDIRSLSMTALDSVEVIRGASALYGNGGAGGVVNYITKRPSEPGTHFLTEIGTEFSLEETSGSAGPFIHQSASGRSEQFDYMVDLSARQTNSYFDDEGERIPPSPQGQGGIADSDIYNFFSKFGYEFGGHRLAFSALYYDQEQDTDFNVLVSGDSQNDVPTRVERGPKPMGAVNPSNTNLVLNLAYTNQNVLGSSVRTQVFHQELENIFDFFPAFFPGGGQSTVKSDKSGGRLDIETPVNPGGAFGEGMILWGADVLRDETEQPLVDGRIWAPAIEQTSYAGFLQFRQPIGERFDLSGGVRHEEINVSFPAFTALFSGDRVPAGDTDYDETTFNAGASFQLTDPLVFYTSYSEGFSVAEVGRILRQAGEETDFSTAQLEASVVENYEAGFRWQQPNLSASLVGFRSESNLGTSITPDLRISRQKQETHGIEATLDARLTEALRLNGSLTWVDGDRDTDNDGRTDRPLPSNLVPPVKLTAALEYDFNPKYWTRFQVLHSDDRDEFDEITAFGEAPIDSFTVIDASFNADLERYGNLSFAINNLMNEGYFPIASQLFRGSDTRFSKAPGRSARISYSIRY